MEYQLNNTDPGGRFAIVASCYYDDIIQGLIDGCLRRLKEARITEERIDIIRVPGALELPLVSKKLADKREHVAIMALGAVIQGDTSHYDVVVNESCRQLSDITVKSGVPVLNAVLTVYQRAQAEERCQNNNKNKGGEAALAALQMVNLLNRLS